jgi:acyl-homoserine-lactone acylase
MCHILILLALVAAACSSTDEDPADGAQDGTDVGTPDGGYEAEIVRTTDGVPHISGETVDDVTFGQGYASAEDRSCDLMDQTPESRCPSEPTRCRPTASSEPTATRSPAGRASS